MTSALAGLLLIFFLPCSPANSLTRGSTVRRVLVRAELPYVPRRPRSALRAFERVLPEAGRREVGFFECPTEQRRADRERLASD